MLLKVKSSQRTLLLCGMWVSECGQEIIIWGISTEFGPPDIMIICELTLTLEQSRRVSIGWSFLSASSMLGDMNGSRGGFTYGGLGLPAPLW